MGRECKRVPLDFDWPLKKVWDGFLLPESLNGVPCPDCENGYSPRAAELHALWYGNLPFNPRDKGSTPFTKDTEEVRAFAERNVNRAPEHYGTSESDIQREAQRLANLFNRSWSHHLSQEEVDHLINSERGLRDLTHTWSKDGGWERIEPPPPLTADQVNRTSIIDSFLIGSSELWTLMEWICEREGVPSMCTTCDGHATVESYPGQREDAENWEPEEPPTGPGYQLWETTSEGSPITPVFSSAEELAQYCVDENVSIFGDATTSYEQWLGICKDDEIAIYSPQPGVMFL